MKTNWQTKKLGEVCEIVNGGTPKTRRWLKRKNLLLKIVEQKAVKEMMGVLGYKMDSKTWL